MDEDLFPELNFKTLQSFARIWAKRFTPTQITLHRDSNPFRYALVFYEPDQHGEVFLDGLFVIQELLTPDFINVYRKEPGWTFRDDWTVVTIKDGEEENALTTVDREHWTLFPKEHETNDRALESATCKNFELRSVNVNGKRGWSLTLEGKTVESSFTGIGFYYLKVLMDNPDRAFGHMDLAEAFGEKPLVKQSQIDYDTGEPLKEIFTGTKALPHKYGAAQKREMELVEEYKETEKDLIEAESNNDLGRKELLQEKQNRTLTELKALQERAEIPRTEQKNINQNYKKVSTAIRRALDKIEKADTEAGKLLKKYIKFADKEVRFNTPI